MSHKNTRKTFDKEFKIQTVKLVLESGRTATSIAEDLGIATNTLYLWKSKYQEDAKNAFPGKGHMKPEEEEIKKLKKDLAHVTMERDILKKAVAFFAKDGQ
jgi:transposase